MRSLTRRTQLKRKKPMRKVGKKTLAWGVVRTALVIKFRRVGLTRCEARYHGCLGQMMLGFAHSKPRRDITTDEEMREVVLCCTCCHREIDAHGHVYQLATVQAIITAREVQP